MNPITINNRQIGPGHPVYVVAEIGSNHDNNLNRATSLIAEAAECGADAAKFQFYRATDLYPGTTTPGAIPDHWLPLLQAACFDNQIDFLCSVFSSETLNVYLDHEPVAVKIASPEATNLELLAEAATSLVPVLVATGACTTHDVDAAHHTLADAPHALLHCTSAYPAPGTELNLRAITTMAGRYQVPIGFSDHSYHPWLAPVLAVAAGACMIEKHFTYDRGAEGPDHSFALEPAMFRRMVEMIRTTEAILGDGTKKVTASEDPTDRRTVTV